MFGGRIDVSGSIYVANDNGGASLDDPLLPTVHVTVASNGWLVGNLGIGSGGYSALTIRLSSGGTYQLWGGIKSTVGQVVVLGDGGTLRSSSEATFQNTTLRIGEGGLTLFADQALTFPVAVENDPAADGIGALTIDCGTAKLLGGVDFTGEIVAKDGRSLVLSGNVAASKITMGTGTLSAQSDVTLNRLSHGIGKVSTLAFAVSNGIVKKFNLKKWDVPNSVNVTLSGAVSGATYDLMTIPADCGASASTFVATSVNDSLSATFSVVPSGDTAIVRATVGPAPAALVDGGTRTWSNAAGGDWATGANWSEGTAPADGARTAVSFPTASSGEKTSVVLNKAAAVSGLAFDAAPGYKVSGSGSIDVYKSGTAVVSSKSGTNAVGTAMTYSGSLRLASQLGSRIELTALEGRGDVQLNDGGTGAATGLSGLGAVVIDNALVNGSLTERNGLLEVGTMGPGISALSIGYGLFRYTGGDYTLNGPLTASPNNWSQAQIEIVNPNTTFTVAGSVTQSEGGFTKRGRGTLVFDGTGEHLLSNASLYKYNFSDAGYANHDNVWGSNGISPIDGSGQAQSFFGLTCAGGLLRWGKDGQTLTVRGGDLVVGTTTTASPGCEYDAAAEIDGGETIVASGDIVISRNHGNSKKNTAEKEILSATLTINDGSVKANNLFLANNNWEVSKTDSQFVQNGGTVEVANAYVGYSDAKSSRVSYTMNGGVFKASNWFSVAKSCPGLEEVTVNLAGGEMEVGYYFGFGEYYSDSRSSLKMTANFNGTTLRCANCIRAYDGSAAVNINEGSTIYAQGIDIFGKYASNNHTLNFNGGRFCCTKAGNFELKDWKTLNIGEKGAWLDTSEMALGKLYFRNAVASAAGAIHVCGYDPMRPVAFDNVSIGSTAVVVEPGGSTFAYSTACAGASATVCGGGAFGSRWTSIADAATQVHNLTLGTNANDRTMLYFTTGSGYITPVKVNGTLAVDGIVEIAVMNDGMTSYEAAAFSSKPILIAPKGSIDKDRFEFTSLMPMVQATLTVESYDDSNDKLVLTTTVDLEGDGFSTHTWKAAEGGAWAFVSNWDTMPKDQTDSKVVFGESLTGTQTVDLGGARTVGAVSSAAQNLTLANGVLAIASTSGGKIETTKGTLTLPAVSVDANGLALATSSGSTQIVSQAISTPAPATAVALNQTSGSGTIRLASPQNGQAFTSSSGTLEGPASAFDGGKVTVKNATLSILDQGFVESPVEDAGAGLNLRTLGEVWFDGGVNVTGPFVKTGPGTAYIGGLGTSTLGGANRGPDASGTTEIPANGDLPASGLGTLSVAAGKLVLGLNDSQTVKVNGRIDIGQCIAEFDSNGDVLDSELEILGGTVSAGDLRVGHLAGEYRAKRDSSKRRNLALTVRGGKLSFANSYTPAGGTWFNGTSTINLYGGLIESTGQYVNFSQTKTGAGTQYGLAKTIINIYGGMFTNTASELKQHAGGAYNLDINLYGGDFAWTAPFTFDGGQAGYTVNINMEGGVFTAPYLRRNYGSAAINFFWNGGMLRPTQNNASFVMPRDNGSLYPTWTRNDVSAGGAAFDIPGDNIYTLNQKFTRDPSLDGDVEDGGIRKFGTGTLLMSVANEFTGPCTVESGVMRIVDSGAVPGGIVLAGGTFDCNSFDFAVPYLKGAGGEAVNGAITVEGMLAPLDSATLEAPYVTVETLAFRDNAVVKCPAAEDEDGWKVPYFHVKKNACTGRIVLDFGLDEETVLPSGLRVKIAEGGVEASFRLSAKAQNYGVTKGRTFACEVAVDQETGLCEVYAVLRPRGTVVVFR